MFSSVLYVSENISCCWDLKFVGHSELSVAAAHVCDLLMWYLCIAADVVCHRWAVNTQSQNITKVETW